MSCSLIVIGVLHVQRRLLLIAGRPPLFSPFVSRFNIFFDMLCPPYFSLYLFLDYGFSVFNIVALFFSLQRLLLRDFFNLQHRPRPPFFLSSFFAILGSRFLKKVDLTLFSLSILGFQFSVLFGDLVYRFEGKEEGWCMAARTMGKKGVGRRG